MRSIFTRSAVAVATLALGSVVLAVTPAQAATSSGVTRDMVLAAANGVRADFASESEGFTDSTLNAARAILNRSCDVDLAGGDEVGNIDIHAAAAGGTADGVLLTSTVYREYEDSTECIIGAIATTDAAYSLSGTVSLDGLEYMDNWDRFSTAAVAALSGDVFVTGQLKLKGDRSVGSATFAATGNAVKQTTTTTTKRVPDQKSSSEKKKAKAKYVSRIKAAKKSYAKALDKAGNSSTKKAAAKKAYKAKRAAAKAKYQYAIASYEDLQQTSVQTDARPFDLSATFDRNYYGGFPCPPFCG